MHARKLRPDDMNILSSNNSNGDDDGNESLPPEGYIVVSRAVTGGKWKTDNENSSSNNEKLVRTEISLGVNC